MELTLNHEEESFLLSILDQRHRELLMEIAHTDNRDFRQALRRDEELLGAIAERLRSCVLQKT